MASLHIAVDSGSHIKKSIGAILSSVLEITRPINKRITEVLAVPALSTRNSRRDMIKVLERAANDDGFIAQLTYEGSKALIGYNLTLEEKAALLSGDIRWIEAKIGKLDDRLNTWLRCRLQQEIW